MNITDEFRKSKEYDNHTRTIYKAICECGEERWLPLKELKSQKYCTKNCKYVFNRRNTLLVCGTCKNNFYRRNSLLKNSNSKIYFCDKFCAAKAQSINGIAEVTPAHYGTSKNNFCKYCNCKKQASCGNICRYNSFIKKWLAHEVSGNQGVSNTPSSYIKRYLVELRGEKCETCGWNERHPVTNNIPIQMDHIDGNSENTTLNNLRLLCPNHHALTETYGSLNIGNGRKHRRKKA